MRIKQIEAADFRCSARTMFERFRVKNKHVVSALNDTDVIVFISKMGNQLLFVHGYTDFPEDLIGQRRALQSVRHQILNGTWNPMALANYAQAAGLDIQGLRLFEEHYKGLGRGSHTAAKKKKSA